MNDETYEAGYEDGYEAGYELGKIHSEKEILMKFNECSDMKEVINLLLSKGYENWIRET